MNVTWKDIAMGVLALTSVILTAYVASFTNQLERQNEAIVRLRISVEVLKSDNGSMRREFQELKEALEWTAPRD